jgi:hypothetical protein
MQSEFLSVLEEDLNNLPKIGDEGATALPGGPRLQQVLEL